MKIALAFNEKTYKHISGVSKRSPMGPLLENVFMAKLGKDIIQKCFDKRFINFSIHYGDSMFLLVKDEDTDPNWKEIKTITKTSNLWSIVL